MSFTEVGTSWTEPSPGNIILPVDGRLNNHDSKSLLDRTLSIPVGNAIEFKTGKQDRQFVIDELNKCHNFKLTSELFTAISQEEMLATVKGLGEAGLLHLPYEHVSCTFDVHNIQRDEKLWDGRRPRVTFILSGNFGKSDSGMWHYPMLSTVFIDFQDGITVMLNTVAEVYGAWPILSDTYRMKRTDQEGIKSVRWMCGQAAGVLMTALATRNVVKRTSVNKRAERGFGKPQHKGPEGTIYLSSTMLDPPASTGLDEDKDHPVKFGASPRAHLRRGHLHMYLHGAGKSLRKTRWVDPVFVNADADFVAKARKYVMTT